MKTLNVGLIGYKFMGKAHSNAWRNTRLFFDMPIRPVMRAVCGRNKDAVQSFANKWGWESIETDWNAIIERDDIDIVDISVPQYLHYPIAKKALQAGKHIFLEKPMALNVKEAEELYELSKKSNVTTYINHNYRRCPAVQLAKQLIEKGKVGDIYHWRGAYLQDWIIDKDFPLTWHLQADKAGSGPQGDLNSHSVDLARFLIGDIVSVTGMTKNFIIERTLSDEVGSGTFSGKASKQKQTGKVTVEDAAFMLVEFENGALGSFEASRFATGRKNYNYFEIYGSKGSIIFNLERMNELEFFDNTDPAYARGFRTIQATEPVHKYIASWWPPGHIIGYEHEFHHAVNDFLCAVHKKKRIQPDFEDGYKEMLILHAGLESAKNGKRITL